jgi:hypothetical protein
MGTQRGPGRSDRLAVRMQVALGGDQRAMTGDLPEHVHRDARVSHPGQPGVAKVMAAQVLIARNGFYLKASRTTLAWLARRPNGVQFRCPLQLFGQPRQKGVAFLEESAHMLKVLKCF